VLSGIPSSRWMGGGKGRGKKEREHLRDNLARKVAEEAEEEARLFAGTLLRLARARTHPDLRELATRLERFLADPSTITDEYWDAGDRRSKALA